MNAEPNPDGTKTGPSTKNTKVAVEAKLGNKNRSARVGKMAAGGTCMEKTQALGRQSWAGAQRSIKNQRGRNELRQ
jgi:hypothetical protein